MMACVKVLPNPYPLDKWMSLEDWHGNNMQFMPSVFRRQGFYYDRMQKVAWVEVQLAGKWIAYTMPRLEEQFKYDLSLMNHHPLLPKEVEAFRIIRRMLPRKVREMLYLDRSWKEIRNTERDAAKYSLHYRKVL